MYAIKITEENKNFNKKNSEVGSITKFIRLPQFWGTIFEYNWHEVGFQKVDIPTITEVQKLGDILEVNGVFKYETIDLTESEIFERDLANSQVVSAIQFISQLSFEGITEAQILGVINTLPEPNKTIAKASYSRAATFERNNPFMLLVSQAFGKTELEMDTIFIKAKKL